MPFFRRHIWAQGTFCLRRAKKEWSGSVRPPLIANGDKRTGTHRYAQALYDLFSGTAGDTNFLLRVKGASKIGLREKSPSKGGQALSLQVSDAILVRFSWIVTLFEATPYHNVGNSIARRLSHVSR